MTEKKHNFKYNFQDDKQPIIYLNYKITEPKNINQ